MVIELRLLAGLRKMLPEGTPGTSSVELADGSKLVTLLDAIGVSGTGCKVILVNGRHAGPETVLRQGDVISVFPPVAGG